VQSKDLNRYFGHAENGYLQVALETGLPGLALILAGIAVCGFWCLAGLRAAPSKRAFVCVGAVAAGLAVSAVHSLADFVWYNPACMTLAVILAACACRLWQLSRDPSTGPSRPSAFARPVAAVAVLGLAVVGAWMIRQQIGPALAQEHLVRFHLFRLAAAEGGRSRHEQVAETATPAGQVSLEAEERMRAELETVVRVDPDDARAHLELAACYLRLFEHHQRHAVNVMPLGQIRDAAMQSRFPSRKALDRWLGRAVGVTRNTSTRRCTTRTGRWRSARCWAKPT